MKIENIRLHAIKIRPLTMDDFNSVLHWSKDDYFCLANGWEQNRSDEEVYQWWMRCVNQSSDDFIRKGIEQDGQLIGYADLAFIKGNSAEIGIAIGESELWGKGIGTQATKCMMAYALENLGITVFHAETHETNNRSRKMLEKIGFEEISREGSEQYLGEESQLIQYRMTL
ncbi:GNAT family N-acetyltransferase [Solibacillus sp. CAU 1738]|uniref:GNAT family N-acetyltransferase n=1 Tax=Solibacillus sp. CAU 1738 TaxID=3140363 RepID=UPI003261953B